MYNTNALIYVFASDVNIRCVIIEVIVLVLPIGNGEMKLIQMNWQKPMWRIVLVHCHVVCE